MRARNFWIGALFAVLTFISLTAFLGKRHRGWHERWHSESCYQSHARSHDGSDAPAPDKQNETNQ